MILKSKVVALCGFKRRAPHPVDDALSLKRSLKRFRDQKDKVYDFIVVNFKRGAGQQLCKSFFLRTHVSTYLCNFFQFCFINVGRIRL